MHEVIAHINASLCWQLSLSWAVTCSPSHVPCHMTHDCHMTALIACSSLHATGCIICAHWYMCSATGICAQSLVYVLSHWCMCSVTGICAQPLVYVLSHWCMCPATDQPVSDLLSILCLVYLVYCILLSKGYGCCCSTKLLCNCVFLVYCVLFLIVSVSSVL